MHQQRQSRWWPTKEPILVAIGIAIVFLVLVSSGCDADWTGFGRTKVNEEVNPAKTLWDWLNLLIVPVVLASAGYLFTSSQNRPSRGRWPTRLPLCLRRRGLRPAPVRAHSHRASR